MLVQQAVGATADGLWGTGTDTAVNIVVSGRNIRELQRLLRLVVDGVDGPRTKAARVEAVKALQRALGATPDGKWGPNSAAALRAVSRRYHL